MKKDLISKSLLLSFIGVFLCIAMFVGTTLATISLTVSTNTNTVTVFDVDIKYDTNFDGDFSNNLKGVTLFDNVVIAPGEDSDIVFIRITNNSGGNVSVSLKLTEVPSQTSGWEICSKIVEQGTGITFNSNNNSEVRTITNNLEFFTLNSLSNEDQKTIAVAVRSLTSTTGTVSFKVEATITK